MNEPINKLTTYGSQIATYLGGTITSYILALPADIHRMALVALWFFILDTLSGIIAGRARGIVTSRKLRVGVMEKLVCYLVIIGVAHGLSVLANRPEWASFGWTGVCLTEALSILENLRPILRAGGKVMRPLSRFTETVASFIDKIVGEKAEAAVATGEASPGEQKPGAVALEHGADKLGKEEVTDGEHSETAPPDA